MSPEDAPAQTSTVDLTGRTLVFVHIPKAAGTTLREHLLGHFDERRCLRLYKNLEAANIAARVDELLRRFGRIDYVFGHIFGGIDQLLPNPCTYITMLRDPFERMTSHYYHARTSKRTDDKRINFAKSHSLGEYVRTYHWLGSAMVKMIAGNEDFGGVDGRKLLHTRPATDELICRAKDRLIHEYAWFGLQERFDESMKLLERQLGFDMTDVRTRNVNRSRRALEELAEEDLAALRECCAPDLELYEFAAVQFERRAARALHD